MKECLCSDIDRRLAIIEGHIKGIRQMVVEEKDCGDILMQLSAVESSIKKTGKIILKNHIEYCVKESVEKGDLAVLDRLSEVLDRYK
ncbi:MAG: metal-sensitive transcriptional regulator [Clostridia bacterium]